MHTHTYGYSERPSSQSGKLEEGRAADTKYYSRETVFFSSEKGSNKKLPAGHFPWHYDELLYIV